MTLVATTPDEQHGDRRRDQPQAGHVAPEQPREMGAVKPSTTPEDPDERRTLMMTGTVTKKPVMNRRRSQ